MCIKGVPKFLQNFRDIRVFYCAYRGNLYFTTWYQQLCRTPTGGVNETITMFSGGVTFLLFQTNFHQRFFLAITPSGGVSATPISGPLAKSITKDFLLPPKITTRWYIIFRYHKIEGLEFGPGTRPRRV